MYELYDECTIMFFFRNKHIMIDLGTGNNNKINFLIPDKQEVIDIIETVYRGARKGRGLVVSPKDYSTSEEECLRVARSPLCTEVLAFSHNMLTHAHVHTCTCPQSTGIDRSSLGRPPPPPPSPASPWGVCSASSEGEGMALCVYSKV